MPQPGCYGIRQPPDKDRQNCAWATVGNTTFFSVYLPSNLTVGDSRLAELKDNLRDILNYRKRDQREITTLLVAVIRLTEFR